MSIGPADLPHDPGEIIDGHNGQKQTFTVKRALPIVCPRTKRRMIERIMVDNFGNEYMHYSSLMDDGEIYDTAIFLTPSRFVKFGGWTDALVDDCRREASETFDRTATDIMKARWIARKAGYTGDGARLILPSNT